MITMWIDGRSQPKGEHRNDRRMELEVVERNKRDRMIRSNGCFRNQKNQKNQ